MRGEKEGGREECREEKEEEEGEEGEGGRRRRGRGRGVEACTEEKPPRIP